MTEWTLEKWLWMVTLQSPKRQHYWNLTIRLFSVISRTIVGGILPILPTGQIYIYIYIYIYAILYYNIIYYCVLLSHSQWEESVSCLFKMQKPYDKRKLPNTILELGLLISYATRVSVRPQCLTVSKSCISKIYILKYFFCALEMGKLWFILKTLP